MYSPSDFRRGLRILVDDEPYYVVEYQHFKMGRGKANIRTKLKHIKSGAVIEKVFSSNDSFKPPDMEEKKMQYLYENVGEFTFMDSRSHRQFIIDKLADLLSLQMRNQELCRDRAHKAKARKSLDNNRILRFFAQNNLHQVTSHHSSDLVLYKFFAYKNASL